MGKLTPIQLKLPSDLLADLNAVCRTGERTQYIVAAIRARLEAEPAAQRAREERKAREAHERRVAEARRQAQAIGDGLDWDPTRIDTFLALSKPHDGGLTHGELAKMLGERNRAEGAGE